MSRVCCHVSCMLSCLVYVVMSRVCCHVRYMPQWIRITLIKTSFINDISLTTHEFKWIHNLLWYENGNLVLFQPLAMSLWWPVLWLVCMIVLGWQVCCHLSPFSLWQDQYDFWANDQSHIFSYSTPSVLWRRACSSVLEVAWLVRPHSGACFISDDLVARAYLAQFSPYDAHKGVM